MTSTAPADVTQYGEVFTRRWVVKTLLDVTGYTADHDLASMRLLEPACGSGAFLGPAITRLVASACSHGHHWDDLRNAVSAYDLQPAHVTLARQLCRDILVRGGAPAHAAAGLATGWIHHGDFLAPTVHEQPADVVVGNPPYVRYDDLTEYQAEHYRRTWSTMRGRGDIYVGFLQRSLQLLRPGGRVGFICADRWMRNQYGSALRELVASHYAVEHIWTMHDVDAFETKVSAYPAITVLANRQQRSAVVAETTHCFGPDSAAALVKATQEPDFTNFEATGVTAYKLPHWFDGGELWPTGSPRRLALIDHLNATFDPLHNPATGTKVSIGVATGADKVYITTDPSVAETDRLTPLAMRQDLMTGCFTWQGNYLINPWADDGTLVRLEDYPKLAAYLASHPQVRNRNIAHRSPITWYRTIDKVHADLIPKPKLLLQDMKTIIHPVLETGGYYPHHNLYYVVSDVWDMEVLGGLLLSRIAQAFIEAYCVRMRGGTLRFQAQYLKRIRVPEPATLNEQTKKALRIAFITRDTHAATAAAAQAYGLDLEEYDLA